MNALGKDDETGGTWPSNQTAQRSFSISDEQKVAEALLPNVLQANLLRSESPYRFSGENMSPVPPNLQSDFGQAFPNPYGAPVRIRQDGDLP